jgi:hypothetical protein
LKRDWQIRSNPHGRGYHIGSEVAEQGETGG